MEVHHHSHHPKKWKEYLTEFLNITDFYFLLLEKECLCPIKRQTQNY